MTCSYIELAVARSSQQSYSVRKGVLRNFANFKGKNLCQSLFFNKVASGPATYPLKLLPNYAESDSDEKIERNKINPLYSSFWFLDFKYWFPDTQGYSNMFFRIRKCNFKLNNLLFYFWKYLTLQKFLCFISLMTKLLELQSFTIA